MPPQPSIIGYYTHYSGRFNHPNTLQDTHYTKKTAFFRHFFSVFVWWYRKML